MESHPIMNTQILHHLGHGDLTYRPDVASFDGDRVTFVDRSTRQVDLVIFATGYKVSYPGLLEKRPEAKEVTELSEDMQDNAFEKMKKNMGF